ncbi:MAG: peptidoglycan DD-metalloendopeptidase family protein [Actinomycetota bacterium]|nr:peptidoglycan DD-metalloendopeptidase family protein [Actinomycetota bacterium]
MAAGGGQAAWGDAASDRDATRQKQQTVKIQLDLAKATDNGVEAELGRLTQAVNAQQARTDAAHQAEVVAQSGVQDATAKLGAIDTRVQGLRQDLARRAVQAYTDPASQGGLVAISRAATFDEAARRKALLDLVQSATSGAVEGLRGTRQDHEEAKKQLESAEKLVRQRAAVEADRTKALRASQNAQQVTHAELTKRIANLMAESAELNGHQSELENLLRARSAPATAGGGGASAVAPGTQVGSGAASSAGMIWPLHGPVTTEFGARASGHPGIDIAAPNGTPIAAAKAGTVVFSGPNDGYGNYVCIDHGGGLSTCYAHQSRIAVSEGQRLNQGEIVGFEGSTGHSTGPHLHFEVRENGVVQNPRNYESGNP